MHSIKIRDPSHDLKSESIKIIDLSELKLKGIYLFKGRHNEISLLKKIIPIWAVLKQKVIYQESVVN